MNNDDLGVWCSICFGDHYTIDCPKKTAKDNPVNYGTCSVCRREQIGKRHEHPCE
jgi:hypothetical protein